MFIKLRRYALYMGMTASLFSFLAACAPALERQLVFWPSRAEGETPADYGADYEVLKLQSEDGTKLSAWSIPTDDSAPWIVFFHGNNTNISKMLNYPMRLRELTGYNLLMAEYRGYYQNEGVPSESGLYQDARAYYTHLRDSGVQPENIILYGFSLGTGVATQLAYEKDIAALVLQAPYTSITDTARTLYHHKIPDGLIKNRFASIEKIAEINAPLLILHPVEDTTIPFDQGAALFEAAVEPKTFLEIPGGHSSLMDSLEDEVDFAKVTKGLTDFLDSSLAEQP